MTGADFLVMAISGMRHMESPAKLATPQLMGTTLHLFETLIASGFRVLHAACVAVEGKSNARS